MRVIERETGAEYRPNIRDNFKRRDWNSILTADGDLDHSPEELFAQLIDGPASEGLQRLRTGDIELSEQDRMGVATFIAAQQARTVFFRSQTAQFMADLAKRMVSLAAANYTPERWEAITGEVPSDEVRARLINGAGFAMTPNKALLLNAELQALDLAEPLSRYSWTLVAFDEPGLFASEQPVLLLPREPPPAFRGVGLIDADIIYVPVSPTYALALTQPPYLLTIHGAAKDKIHYGDRLLAAKLNYRMLTAPRSEHILTSTDTRVHPLPSCAAQAAFPTELLDPRAA